MEKRSKRKEKKDTATTLAPPLENDPQTSAEPAAASMKAAALVTGMIMLSKVIGFLRDATMNATFGPQALDPYTQAFTMLSWFTLLFSSGVSSVFIPIYTKEKLEGGQKQANRYANNVVNLYIIVGILVTVLSIVFVASPRLVGLLYPKTAEQTAGLARILFLSITFSAVWGVFCNILNANERFLPETFQGYILSACVMIACFVFGSLRAVAIATAIAPIIQLLSTLPFLRKVYRYSPTLHIRDEKLRRTFWLALPAMIAMEFDTFNNAVDSVFAARMTAGSNTYLGNCYKIIILLQGVFVVPLTTVSYPRLSRSAGKGDKQGIIDSVKQMTELLAAVLFPIILIAIAMRKEIISILFQRGAFTAQDTANMALPLALYLIGVFGFGLRNYQSRVFYAMQQTKPPMVIGICMVGVTVLIDVILVLGFGWGVEGLTLATSISGTLGAFIMLMTLHKRLGKMGIRSTAMQLLRTGLAALVGLAATLLVRRVWTLSDAGFALRFVYLAVCGLTGLAAYAISARILKVNALNDIVSIVTRKKKKS